MSSRSGRRLRVTQQLASNDELSVVLAVPPALYDRASASAEDRRR